MGWSASRLPWPSGRARTALLGSSSGIEWDHAFGPSGVDPVVFRSMRHRRWLLYTLIISDYSLSGEFLGQSDLGPEKPRSHGLEDREVALAVLLGAQGPPSGWEQIIIPLETRTLGTSPGL
jgi:hypothetical protein